MAMQVPWAPGLASLYPTPLGSRQVQGPVPWWKWGGMQKGENHLASYRNRVGTLETDNRKPEKGFRRPETGDTASRPLGTWRFRPLSIVWTMFALSYTLAILILLLLLLESVLRHLVTCQSVENGFRRLRKTTDDASVTHCSWRFKSKLSRRSYC